MDRYLLIESLDPFESNDVAHYQALAASLARAGNQVTLFLVQNGVLAARQGARAAGLAALAEQRVEILADDFSLRERGIAPSAVAPSVALVSLDVVIERLADGWRTLWH